MPRVDADTTAAAGRRRPRLRVLLTTVAGLAGLAAAGWSGHADLLVVGSAGVIVLGLGILLALGAESGAVRIPVHPSVPAVSGSREEAETYALALELAPNPVLLVSGGDADDVAARRVLFANAEARELLRIPRDGALLVTALRHPGVLEAIDESLFGRTPRTLSYESGPQERFWRVWTKPLPPTSTHDRLALVIMRDETDVRQNERMRADFLANASHELRTPLASLTGFIETLRGHARDDEVARDRFLAIMSRQAERMARLIDDLLSLSRIELNEHIRPSGRCDLGLVTTDVIDALAPQISAKQVRIEVQGPVGDKALVAGDRDQIVQVVQNLLDNAVKYAPPESVVRVEIASGLTLEAVSAARPEEGRLTAPDGGRMSLLTPVRAAAERFAMVRVDDRGCGLTREHLPRLTERFYRVEGQNSGERTGTGLGLAIVKHIINRHRGGFFVESAPERGAAFCVYLPMAPTVATAPTDGSAVSPRSESKGEGVAA